MTKNIKTVVFSVLAVAALALSLSNANPSNAAVGIADAKGLFAQYCASCHGVDGSGNTPIGKSMKLRALGSPEVQKLADAKLNEIISKGKNKMPGFSSKLNAEEIKGLVAHIHALAKK